MIKIIDYKKLGFKAGLEIHQQLDSDKLFCKCHSVLRSDEPDFIIKRKLHAVAGEGGEVDVAAEYQSSLGEEFVYQGYDSVCLVELDEEPPHLINLFALKTALQIAILLNAKILPLSQIMRKTVIDGSNTSGFQRTVMIARDGFVETSEGRIGIEGVFLEEDSARPAKEGENVFKLDRLGIPLVEIATAPDIKTPEQAKETALKIGQILRLCNVRRGIGTIRQDINMSTKGHGRVEVKGFQDPKMMIKTIDLEIERQQDEVKRGKDESAVRGALPDGSTKFLRPMPGAARMYPETDLPLLKIHRNLINEAKKTLPKLKSEMEGDLKKMSLSKEMMSLLLKSNKVEEFKELVGILNKPDLIVKILLVFPREVASREKISAKDLDNKLNSDILHSIVENLKKGKISQSQVKEVMTRIVRGEELKDAIEFEKHDLVDLDEKVMKIIKSKPGLSVKAYMGLVMQELKGKVSGKEAMEIILKYVR